MSDIITPHSPEYTIHLPEDPVTWLFLVAWFLLIVVCLIIFQDRNRSFDRRNLSWLAILSALVLVLTPFWGLMLFPNSAQHGIDLPVNHFMFFAAVPWMVAVGVLGLLPAGLIAAISGLLLAYLDTHQVVTPLVFMTMSFVFSLVIRQSRPKGISRAFKLPAVGAIVTWIFSTPVAFISIMLTTQGPIGLRFASAFTSLPQVFLTLGGMILVGGFTATLVDIFLPESWQAARPVEPPDKISLSMRLIIQLALLFFVLFSIISVSIWRISENTARKILVEQLTDNAGLVAKGMDLFVSTGKSQIETLAANDDLAVQDPETLPQVLAQEFVSQTYFNLLAVFTPEGELVASHPPLQDGLVWSTSDEAFTISEARFEVSSIILTVPPVTGGQTAQVSFIIGLKESGGQTNRVLLARTQPSENQIAEPFLAYLHNLENHGGIAQIIDGQNRRLYHTDPDLLMTDYLNPRFTTTTFFESTTVDSQDMMMSYHPSGQASWAVVTAFPIQVRHLMAWDFAKPLLLVGFVGNLVLFLAVFLLISPLASELSQLKAGISSIIEGHLPSESVGDKGMRAGYEEIILKRIDSLNRRVQQQRDLLRIVGLKTHRANLRSDLSQVMKAALAQGVSSVRIVLGHHENKNIVRSHQGPYGLGRDARLFAQLDAQVYSLVDNQGAIILRDFQIEERLSLPDGVPTPASLMAFPLRSGEDWFGVLWVTFPEKRNPGQEEVDFFGMLSERAVDILASNAFMEEITSLQKRMAAALDELPQAILLTDEAGRIVYHNPRLGEMLNFPPKSLLGRDVPTIFKENHLPELVGAVERGEVDKEISLENGSVLRFRLTPIDIDGKREGSAMLFEPLKGFKAKLDSSTELVTMVSHALRSPLTLIHGYAKILRLTGNLNDQQDDYTGKIINGIEEMRSLVQNLLEVGRLESLGVMDFSEFHISQVIQMINDSMEAQFRQKNIKLFVSKPDEPIKVWADFTLLTQALKNLVDNALKFTKMGGKVVIKVWREDGRVVFSVKDTGPGIAPLDQRHLFEKFQHGKGVTGEESAGGGLGLAITRSIMEHHGGRVWLESQLGQGSTFFIEIPEHPA